MYKTLGGVALFLLLMPVSLFSGQEGKGVPATPVFEAVFEISVDGYGEGPMLHGTFVSADGSIYAFDNTKNFHQVHAMDGNGNSGLVSAPVPAPSGPTISAPQPAITQEFLAKKFGADLKKMGVIDPGTMKKMRDLIPLAEAGELPPIRVEGDDIVARNFFGYFLDPQTQAWKQVMIGLTVTSQTRVRNNEAGRTLFTFLKEKVLKK